MMPDELERYLHEQMPLTRAMGVGVAEASPGCVRLALPLAANTNHQRTAFGGSISAAAVLAAWSLLHLRLRAAEEAGEIVIADSRVRFIRPITGDFEALCEAPSAAAWEAFVTRLRTTGKGRIELRSQVADPRMRKVAASHDGVYVVSRA